MGRTAGTSRWSRTARERLRRCSGVPGVDRMPDASEEGRMVAEERRMTDPRRCGRLEGKPADDGAGTSRTKAGGEASKSAGRLDLAGVERGWPRMGWDRAVASDRWVSGTGRAERPARARPVSSVEAGSEGRLGSGVDGSGRAGCAAGGAGRCGSAGGLLGRWEDGSGGWCFGRGPEEASRWPEKTPNERGTPGEARPTARRRGHSRWRRRGSGFERVWGKTRRWEQGKRATRFLLGFKNGFGV